MLFVFFLDYVPGIIGEIGNLIPQYRQTGIAFSRLHTLLRGAPPQRLVQHHNYLLQEEHVPALAQIPSLAEPLQFLEVRDLSCTYAGTQQGIKGVSFQLRRGECLVITGRIGSGKTTLLRTLLGLLLKDQGQIYWNGKLIHDPATFFTPPHTAYTSQIPRLFSETPKTSFGNDCLSMGIQRFSSTRTVLKRCDAPIKYLCFATVR